MTDIREMRYNKDTGKFEAASFGRFYLKPSEGVKETSLAEAIGEALLEDEAFMKAIVEAVVGEVMRELATPERMVIGDHK